MEIIKERTGEISSNPMDSGGHDPPEDKKEKTCEEIRNFLAKKEVGKAGLHPNNQSWEDDIMKADFEWQIDNIRRKVIVNATFVKERDKKKSDRKAPEPIGNSKLSGSPTNSRQELEEPTQDNTFSSKPGNESNQQPEEIQPSNATNPGIFPWKIVVPIFLFLISGLVLGFLVTKKEKPSSELTKATRYKTN